MDPYRYTGVYEFKYGLRTKNMPFDRVGPHDVRLPPLLRHRILGFYRIRGGNDLTVGSNWK